MDDQEIKTQNYSNQIPVNPASRPRHLVIKILLAIILVGVCGFLIFNYFKNNKSSVLPKSQTQNNNPASLETIQATLNPHQKLQISGTTNLSPIVITNLPQELQGLTSVDASQVSVQQGVVGSKAYYQINYSVAGVELPALHLSLMNLFKKNWTYVYAERSNIYAFIEEQDQNYQMRVEESIADRSQPQNISVVMKILAK